MHRRGAASERRRLRACPTRARAPRLRERRGGRLSSRAAPDDRGGGQPRRNVALAPLCAPVQASECRRDGCSDASVWELNLPQFVEIDLVGKTINTTRSSSENRSTSIDSVKRDAGLIVLQGYEQGRAFSMVITESTGFATMGITVDDGGVLIFASCTRANS